jgi:hypothetical protein
VFSTACLAVEGGAPVLEHRGGRGATESLIVAAALIVDASLRNFGR